ncbi:MAG: hypothetical protein ACR2RL_05045 [Gammaproteobacteria bacterium]
MCFLSTKLPGARPALLVVALTGTLAGCTGQAALTPATVIWEDAGGSVEAFESDCRRCQGHVRFEALARDFESPVRRTSGAERYARARAWGRSALAACLVDAGYAARVAPGSEAPSPERSCSIDDVIYP